MRGLLADVNLEGHLRRIQQLLERDGLLDLLAELGLELVTLKDIGLPPEVDDRTLWQRCQHDGWVLFTDNRNDDGETSLQTTLNDWAPGKLPVLTLADKRRFERSTEYRRRVAADIADVLFGITGGEYRDRDRIFVPR
ncbi:MAG TPA: DUF5615 family PIN-like protein [Pirellulales bacterium]|nr:DUF5615 family PIN-like protein [Pirellulales bacterium]